MFKNRKLFKDFISGVKERKYTKKEAMDVLKTLPNKVIRNIGREIIYTDFDGYNSNSKCQTLAYFDNLDRWQKEFYIEQRLYKLYT
jgi:hypothetical protein